MLCMGYLEDDWQGKLFLKTSSIAATSSSSGPEYWWQATVQWFSRVGTRVTGCIVLITFAPFYGGLLLFLCNNTQHVGLQDEVSDYRLCTRTIYLNPVVEFLYWHMNFHIEHHMFAGVPCYKLGRLHRAIAHDLPPSPDGLVATWQEIVAILRQQKVDPTYEYVPPVPTQPATA